MYKEFTKADLKNGMVIEQRCSIRKIVIDDRIVGYNDYGKLRNYGDDLLHWNNTELDIVKIYKPSNTIEQAFKSNLELLWERSEVKEVTMAEVKEVTMAEVEEKFGCKVKIVSENQ